MDVLRPLWSPRTWQVTFHVVAGMFLGAATGAVIWSAGVFWWAAVVSLVEGPTGRWALAVVYVVVAVVGPLAVPPCVRFFSALQRERFRAVLDVAIAPPGHDPGIGWRRVLGPWVAGSTWRQIAYHLLAPVLGGLGGLMVLLCWSALPLTALWSDSLSGPWFPAVFGGATVLLLAAPWVARGVAAADTAAARRLLGRDHAEELAERVESLARSRADMVAAADAERRRIERDLHDGVQQRLVALALHLGMARNAVAGVPPEVQEVIAAAHDEATAALAELRDFVRGLHPAVLNDRGLDAALSGIAARAPLPVKLRVDIAPRCSPSIEAIAYFAVSEALTNVAKHARASRAEVSAKRVGDRLIITVTDDGRGGAAIAGAATEPRGVAQRAAGANRARRSGGAGLSWRSGGAGVPEDNRGVGLPDGSGGVGLSPGGGGVGFSEGGGAGRSPGGGGVGLSEGGGVGRSPGGGGVGFSEGGGVGLSPGGGGVGFSEGGGAGLSPGGGGVGSWEGGGAGLSPGGGGVGSWEGGGAGLSPGGGGVGSWEGGGSSGLSEGSGGFGLSAGGGGTGLRGLSQRAAAVDGRLTVVSPLGGPTTVTVDIPCE